MTSDASKNSSAMARYSASHSEQPFPGAVPFASSAVQPRGVVMEIPPPLPRPSFIFRGDGAYSNDASWVFSSWMARIDQYISASSPATDVNGIHLPRCFLLSAACRRQDVVYIVMHHRYCIWSLNRQTAYILMQPYAPAAIDSAFAALSVLLKSNDVLPTTQVRWFSNFPAPAFDSYIPSQILASITEEIFNFLATFASKWHDLQARITARGFPVLIWEIAQTLQCSSRSVQDLIFTLSRRLLGCPDGPFSIAFAELFEGDRRFESDILSNPVSPNHIQQSRNTLVRNYLGLAAQFRSQAQIAPVLFASPSLQALPARTPATQDTAIWPPQGQHSQISEAININEPSTIPSTIQPAPATCGSANAIQQTVQYAGTSPDHPPPAGPTPVHSRNMFASMAQSNLPAVAQSSVPSTPNLAALLDPAPGKVFRPIPESEYPHSAYSLPSLKVGLHLARQRSPLRVSTDNGATKYYQYVDSLIVQPTRLDVSTHLTHVKFSLSEDQVQKLPVRQGASDICALPVVRFENNTLRFRVRVCRFASGETEIGESKWVGSSTFWPAQMHITINSMPCLLSRKQHFHTDLPAEMSTDVKAGYNELHVSLPSLCENERGHDYFIAVEQITTQNHASVWAGINSSLHASAETTKETIRCHFGLGGTDEITLLGRTSNISVCDPISSIMCETPVRGVNCNHLQCFDLENWLQSRTKKLGSPLGEPCAVDCWACPICGGDARPNQLRICDYFANVVNQLRERGHPETRTIALSQNGDWEPQLETTCHQKRENSSQPRGLQYQPHQLSKDLDVVEVIDD